MVMLVNRVFVILISKELLVFNAETLVLVCFGSFVGRVARSGRKGIVGFFEAREAQIQKEVELQRSGLLVHLTAYRESLDANQSRVARFSEYRILYYTAVEARKAKATADVEIGTRHYLAEQLKRMVTLETKAFGARQQKRAVTIPEQVYHQLVVGTTETEVRLEESIKKLEEEGKFDWSFTSAWMGREDWFYCFDDPQDSDSLSILHGDDDYDSKYAEALDFTWEE